MIAAVNPQHNPSLESSGTPEPEGTGVTAGLYVRVSTLNQVDHDSLSTQESRLRAYCQANGFRVYNVYREAGVSAKDTNRPKLASLLGDCKNGKVQAVLVTALDRITRSLRDLIRLVDFFAEHNVRFVSITQSIDSSTSFGRFMRDLLGLIARLEREVDAERVSTDMHYRASLGKWNGGVVPYGYTTFQRVVDELTERVPEDEARKKAGELAPEPKRLYIDPEEAEAVKRIFDTFIQTRSLRKTTHAMNSQGIRTRAGKAWALSSVHRVLTNPTYTGKIWYGRRKTDIDTGKRKKVPEGAWKVVDGKHEPIISESVFKKAREILDATSMKPTRAFRTYLLSGFLRCGKCGGPMHGFTFSKKSSMKTYSYYKCHNRNSMGSSVCSGMTVSAKDLEDFVVKTLMGLSRDKPFLQDKEKMLAIIKDEMKPGKGKEALERLKKQESALEKKVETLLEMGESRLIDRADFAKEYEKLKSQLKENRLSQESLSDATDHSKVAYEALNASFEEVSSFGKNWEFLDDRARATKISTIVKQIKVYEGRLDMQVYLDAKNVFRTGGRR